MNRERDGTMTSTTAGNGNGAGAQATQATQAYLEMGRTYADAFLRATRAASEAQTAYLENLFGTLQSQASRPSTSAYGEAFKVWVQALQEANRLTLEAAEKGEAPPTEEIFDLWTNAFADISKSLIWNPTYAAAQGEVVSASLDARRRLQEQGEASLRAMGVATRSDVLEVARRLVELERRQHDLTRTLQAFLDAQEAITLVPGAPEGDASEGKRSRGKGGRGGEKQAAGGS